MTPQELKIYQLQVRVMLLERVLASISIGLLMKAGVTIEQSRAELIHALEREGNRIQVELPSLSQGNPAQNALLLEELREIVEGLKALVDSHR